VIGAETYHWKVTCQVGACRRGRVGEMLLLIGGRRTRNETSFFLFSNRCGAPVLGVVRLTTQIYRTTLM
jgi:hypothetical protein